MSVPAVEEGLNGVSDDSGKEELPTTTKPAEAKPDKPAAAPEYVASIFPGPSEPISQDFAEAALELQEKLGKPLWVLSWGFAEPYPDIDEFVRLGFFRERAKLRECDKGAALLIDSPGGIAGSAYQIASLFRRHCGGSVSGFRSMRFGPSATPSRRTSPRNTGASSVTAMFGLGLRSIPIRSSSRASGWGRATFRRRGFLWTIS